MSWLVIAIGVVLVVLALALKNVLSRASTEERASPGTHELRGTPAPELPTLAPEAAERVRSLARDGKKIEAIKALRVATGLGLAEAKAWVDAQETR